MTDYKRYEDSIPQTIVVTRTVKQNRLKDAAFDPAKRNSRNVRAGLVPVMTGGGVVYMMPDEDDPL
jgi:hypothetical protein